MFLLTKSIARGLRSRTLANRSRYFLFIVALFGCGLGCNDGATRVLPEAIDANAAQNAVEMLDLNKDGLIDSEELANSPGLRAAMSRVDTNGDEKLSAAEIGARILSWQKSKVGRLALPCRFTQAGQPLAQASVSLIPEPFLGDKLKPVSVVTDSQGMVVFSSAANLKDPQGVSVGFYRVEVRKQDGSVPAKFNVQTTLGIEVAIDSTAIANGFATFEIP